MPKSIYLDNNATTAVDPRVFEAMTPCFLTEYGNPSSIHRNGRAARVALEEARRQVALALGARPSEVILTCGGTEADNLALLGIAAAGRENRKRILTSSIEHPAVLAACKRLEGQGFEVAYLPAASDGAVRVEDVEEALDEHTALVSIMLANNETGALQPMEEICRLAHSRGALVHTDAVQAMGKIPLDVGELGVDSLSLSAHKFHGPKGVGALYLRQGIKAVPFMLGGAHEQGRRAGTENVPGAVGLGKACELALKEMEDASARMKRLRDRLESGILAAVPDAVVNGNRQTRTPQTSNISFLGAEGEALLMAFDLEGIAVSTGAACHSGEATASHVLTAMRLPKERIQGAIRFSLGKRTSEEEIESVLSVLPALVDRVRKAASV